MKKLMILAAVAAMVGGASASLCTVDSAETSCQAYNLSIKLKTLAPKTVKCKDTKCSDKGCVSYYKNGTRTLKGILWNCASECDLASAKLALWRTNKGFQHAIAEADAYFGLGVENGVQVYTAMDWNGINLPAESYRYEKKANKVSMVWGIADAQEAYWYVPQGQKTEDGEWKNDFENSDGDTAPLSLYTLNFAGLGSFDTKKGIIKNVSGYVAGSVTGDPTIKSCDFPFAGIVDLCDDYEALCDDIVASDGSQNLAAYGTWKLKYSKKISGGTASVASYVPSYAK